MYACVNGDKKTQCGFFKLYTNPNSFLEVKTCLNVTFYPSSNQALLLHHICFNLFQTTLMNFDSVIGYFNVYTYCKDANYNLLLNKADRILVNSPLKVLYKPL